MANLQIGSQRATDGQMKALFALGAFVLLGVCLGIGITEVRQPGYGLVSQITSSPEQLAAARNTAAEAVAEREVVDSIGKQFTVFCPDEEKWAALSETDKSRWHSHFLGRGLTLYGDSAVCYDP